MIERMVDGRYRADLIWRNGVTAGLVHILLMALALCLPGSLVMQTAIMTAGIVITIINLFDMRQRHAHFLRTRSQQIEDWHYILDSSEYDFLRVFERSLRGG